MSIRNEDLLKRLTEQTDLGHLKKDSAFLRQVALMCSSSGATVPQSAGKSAGRKPIAEAVSFYRLVGDEEISLGALRDIRAKVVLDGLTPGSELLLLHDMSPLDYSRHESKKDRRLIGDHKGRGYEYTACLAVDSRSGETLGVVHDTVVSAEGPDDRDDMDYDYEPLFADFSEEEKRRLRDNHRHQMAVHINGTASLLSKWHVVDVADREFDDVFVVDRCRQNGRDFVIRSSANRNVQTPLQGWIPETALTTKQNGHGLREGYVYVNLSRLIEHVPMHPYKTLPLDARGRVVEIKNAKRLANLSIGTFSIYLYRAAKRNKRYVESPREVDLNVVVIREINALPQEEPLLWVLFTSLPVGTNEQMAHVGEIYEKRWHIEDYFKLLKSGYHVLDSRLDDAGKIGRSLIICSLAAMTVLRLKQQANLPPGGYLNDNDYRRVSMAMMEPNNDQIEINLRLFALTSRLGGWLGRRRDPIGSKILMRGMLSLLDMFLGLTAFAPLLQEAARNPDALGGLLRRFKK